MENLTISIIGAVGAASLAQLETGHGPCCGTHHGSAVTLVARADKSASCKYFDLPPDLAKAFAGGGCYIAPGILVGLGTIDRSHLRAEGAGAQVWQAAQSMPGLRSRLPELSAGWLAAIRSAVKGA